MIEEERRKLCSLFDKFTGSWSVENVQEVMRLGLCLLNDIPKLRGCYTMLKEDPSVFVDPITSADPAATTTNNQWILDKHFSGFAFAPNHLLTPYIENRLNRANAGKLFCYMTNFVASNSQFVKGDERLYQSSYIDYFGRVKIFGTTNQGQLYPSSFLDVVFSDEQQELLNPTCRDVQMGAIIDQCIGIKATRNVARRRLDMVQGNFNSYACILNGEA